MPVGVVGDRGRLGERQPRARLHAGNLPCLSRKPIHRSAGAPLRIRARESAALSTLRGDLPRGRDPALAEALGRPLRRRIEGADRLDHGAVQLDPQRGVSDRGVDVHHAAAARELPGRADHLRPLVTGGEEPSRPRRPRARPPGAERPATCPERRGRLERSEDRLDRDDQDRALPRREGGSARTRLQRGRGAGRAPGTDRRPGKEDLDLPLRDQIEGFRERRRSPASVSLRRPSGRRRTGPAEPGADGEDVERLRGSWKPRHGDGSPPPPVGLEGLEEAGASSRKRAASREAIRGPPS